MQFGTGLQRIAIIAVVVPSIGAAQSPLQVQDPSAVASLSPLELGGRSSMDLVRLDGGRYSFPLRFASVRPGSERLEIAGRTLIKGVDYSIDYASGVVYLLRPFRDGDAMRAQYKYDEKSTQIGSFTAQSSETSGFSGLRLEFNRQSSFYVGLGMTERLGDGTVLSSNVYGVSNSYSMGGGALKGVFMVGERERSTAVSMFGAYGGGRQQKDEGTGTAIVQNFQSSAFGGQISVDYQDIDSRFAGFDALKQNGVSADTAEALRKERGFKRSGFSMRDIVLDRMKFSSGFRSVGDADGTIDWRSLSGSFGGLKVNWDSQSVDMGFQRFADLKESDRVQLQKERGLDREAFGAGFVSGKSAVAFNSFNLTDALGNGIKKEAYSFDSPFVKLNYLEQSVGDKFGQFAGLRPEYDAANKFNVGQMQKEVGLDRRQMSLESAVKGSKFGYSQSSVSQDGTGLDSESLSMSAGSASIEHRSITTDTGFARFQSLTPEEQQATVRSIADMVESGKAADQNDLALFGQSSGLDRELWRLKYDFGGGLKASVSENSIKGAQAALESQTYTLTSANFNLNYKSFDIGDEFSEASRLMQSEQSAYGAAPGLAKTDLSVGYSLDKLTSLSFSQMDAAVGRSDASRTALGFKGKGIDVQWSRRAVDASFQDASRLVDPERDLLTSLMGYEQESLVAKLQLLPQVGVTINWSDAENMTTAESRSARETGVDWKLSPETTLAAYRAEQNVHDDASAKVDRALDRLTLRHDLGKLGVVSLLQEQRRFDGEEENLPDSVKMQVGYQTSLNKNTQVGTEQSETQFSNGERETATTNIISTQVTDRVGVSFSDTKVLREGENKDATKRDYGFWLDFGKNVRFSYGEARNLMDPNSGTENVKAGLTSGQFAGIDVKSLQYTQDVWDGKRSKSLGSVNLKTVRPLDLGFVNNVEFFYLVDTVHDMDKWQKENRSMGISGNFGRLSLGFGYRNQISPTGDRAIDRVLSFNTDTTGKSAIRAELSYDLRTMPNDETIAIRDLKFVAKPFANWQIEHSMQTNPLKVDDRALLGGIAQDTRLNNWRISCLADPNTKGGFVFEELRNDKTNMLTRRTGVDVTLFAKNLSPLTLGYRSVLSGANNSRSTAHEFWLKFDQKPGPNQSLSLMLGNMNYDGLRPNNRPLHDWSMRLDYGFRF